MANILTVLRIACGILILSIPPFSKWFYILYIIGVSTDLFDGAAARLFGTDSPFGAKLDTAADFIFALSVTFMTARAVHFPIWLSIWIGIIVAIKAANIVIGFVKYKTFVAVHNTMNKICGAVICIFPLIIGCEFICQAIYIVIGFACLLANTAAIVECITILKRDPNE